MNANLIFGEDTKTIIQAFFNVYNRLGFGFLEKVYEKSMEIEITELGLSVVRQHPIDVYYKGQLVGEYACDLMVEDRVIVEVKRNEKLNPAHESQLLNYLKATHAEVGLLLNFGQKAEYRRKIFTNERKPLRSNTEVDRR